MDTEDGNHIGDTSGSEVKNIEKNSSEGILTTDGISRSLHLPSLFSL